VEAGGSDDPVLGELLRRISGGIVPVRDDLTLDRITLAAGRVRLGEPGPEGSVRLSTAPDAPAGAEGGAGADPSPPVILTVEDDPVASALVQHKLRHVGFEILHFDNGDEALAALPHTDFDLAIFDLNLPGADGFQLVKAVRAHERKHGGRRPIIILSGMTGEEAIVRGLELGADDYILKPFSPVELTARVRRLLPSDRSRR
jgi:CheY-like chemotaxis protein